MTTQQHITRVYETYNPVNGVHTVTLSTVRAPIEPKHLECSSSRMVGEVYTVTTNTAK